jgi:hypothetical protein
LLIVCGTDSRQVVGHLPGQSLLALAANGIDDGMRILGARGKRPLLRNGTPEAVGSFRNTVGARDTNNNARTSLSGRCLINPGSHHFDTTFQVDGPKPFSDVLRATE